MRGGWLLDELMMQTIVLFTSSLQAFSIAFATPLSIVIASPQHELALNETCGGVAISLSGDERLINSDLVLNLNREVIIRRSYDSSLGDCHAPFSVLLGEVVLGARNDDINGPRSDVEEDALAIDYSPLTTHYSLSAASHNSTLSSSLHYAQT